MTRAVLRGQQALGRSASAMVSPTMMRDAAFASGMPSAFDTNGTVRDARGFASST